MTKYLALIDGKAGKYGLIVPDAPGCVAMGRTVEEATSHGVEALADWVGDTIASGRKPPKPSTAEQLRKDPDIASDLETGSIFVLLPLVLDTGRSARANISLDAGLLTAIDEAARRQNVTRSAFIAAAARDKIKQTA